jgi:hypothetical protein
VKLLNNILYKEMAYQLRQRPALKLGEVFTALSVKRGVLGGTHIDKSDDIDTFAIITAIGDWKHGNLALGQLELECPIQPDKILLVRAGLLQHGNCYAIKPNKWIGYTGFINSRMYNQAEDVGKDGKGEELRTMKRGKRIGQTAGDEETDEEMQLNEYCTVERSTLSGSRACSLFGSRRRWTDGAYLLTDKISNLHPSQTSGAALTT